MIFNLLSLDLILLLTIVTKFLDKKLKVIIDRKEENTFFGRTEFDSPEVDNEIIIKENTKDLKIGNFYNVIVKKALNYDLHCELI